jgi:hypothetical protein
LNCSKKYPLFKIKKLPPLKNSSLNLNYLEKE